MVEKRKCGSVCAVVWTFNPNVDRFLRVLESIYDQVEQVIVVDNCSSNFQEIKNICNRFNNVILIEINFNSGVRALNIGMKYAIEKFHPSFILLLDDDTIVYPNAISKVLNRISSTKLSKVIGIVQMVSRDVAPRWKEKLITCRYGIFSGSLINAEVIRRGLKVREEFFLDQADFDFYNRTTKLGFLTVWYGEKLIDHELGVKISLPRLRKPYERRMWTYEPSWRYYLLVRNSTVLLLEGCLDVVFYLKQLILLTIPLLFVYGVTRTLKALVLGLTHGLFRKLGFLDPSNI